MKFEVGKIAIVEMEKKLLYEPLFHITLHLRCVRRLSEDHIRLEPNAGIFEEVPDARGLRPVKGCCGKLRADDIRVLNAVLYRIVYDIIPLLCLR